MYIHSHFIKVLTLKISYLPSPWNCQSQEHQYQSDKIHKAKLSLHLVDWTKRFEVWKHGLKKGSNTFIVKLHTWIRHYLLKVNLHNTIKNFKDFFGREILVVDTTPVNRHNITNNQGYHFSKESEAKYKAAGGKMGAKSKTRSEAKLFFNF